MLVQPARVALHDGDVDALEQPVQLLDRQRGYRLGARPDEPVLLQESYIPHAVCPALLAEELEKQSILELLEERCGVRVSRVRDYIEVVALGEEEAQILGLATGSPALLLEQYFYAGGAQVMYSRTLKRPERFRFVIDLERN